LTVMKLNVRNVTPIMKHITVLLADDNGVVRKEYRKILELEDDLEVVGDPQSTFGDIGSSAAGLR